MSGAAATANPFDQFDPPPPAGGTPSAAASGPAPPQPTSAVPIPGDFGVHPATPSVGTSPAPSSASGNPFDQFDAPEPTASPAAGNAAPSSSAQPPAQPQTWGQWVDSVGREAAQIPSFGLADKFAAGMDALTQPVLGRGSDASTLGQRYAADLTAQRAQTAADPTSAKVVGNAAGLAGAVATDVPGMALRGAGAVAEAIPGANALLSVARPSAQAVENGLLRLPGTATLVPVAKAAATNALGGAVVGGVDADGDANAHLQGAAQGATIGGLIGAGGSVAAQGVGHLAGVAIGKAGQLGRAVYQDLGGGTKAPVLDQNGTPLSAPVTPAQADKAASIVSSFTSDPAAARAALDAHAADPNPIPGFQPTSFQVTGDTGQGQLEQATRIANQPQYNTRATQQNDALVNAVQDQAPAGSDAYTVQPALQAQVDAADAAGQAQLAGARASRDQAAAALPDTDAATPDTAGGVLRDQVAQAQAPAIAQADQRVAAATTAAQDATQAVGGTAAGGDATTGLQDLGAGFRQTLIDTNAAAKARVSGLYDQADPEGKLGLDVTPIKQMSSDITQGMTASAKPMGGEEAEIHRVIADYPDVQSMGEVRDLAQRIGDAIAELRGQGGNRQAIARLTQMQGAVQDNMETAAANGGEVPAASAAADATSATTSAGGTAGAPQEEQADANLYRTLSGWSQNWYNARDAEQPATASLSGSQESVGRVAASGSGAVPGARYLFSPGVWWYGLSLNRSGSWIQIRQTYSYGVIPFRVFSLRAWL